TAVKISPNYDNPTVWVKDASRAVGVVSNLLSDTVREAFVTEIAEDYEQVRERHKGKTSRRRVVSLEQARANRVDIDWPSYAPPKPRMTGLQAFADYPLEEIAQYIDWTPFFWTWEMKGKFPQILEDETIGEEARKLFDDAGAMLRRIIDEKWLQARAVIGLFPANAVDDDIEIYDDESRRQVRVAVHHLRQQNEKPPGRPNLCLSDFIAPKETKVEDYLGAFAATAGVGLDERVKAFEQANDDYNAILLQALADRLAEAFAERMHERVRREFWAYAPDEDLDNEALIKEEYTGIRPAPGYPACPDHTEKGLLWELLDAEGNAGIRLTESYAMWPASSVSGWYFSHPRSQYFVVNRVGRDQVADYAERKGMSFEEAEKWLMPVLAYEPDEEKEAV
ncbi:MAG: methionine synthase, partial [Gammaproteobacteria bacterium]|nr:methionine synthase [Gammaproteobacteria bacterium]